MLCRPLPATPIPDRPDPENERTLAHQEPWRRLAADPMSGGGVHMAVGAS